MCAALCCRHLSLCGGVFQRNTEVFELNKSIHSRLLRPSLQPCFAPDSSLLEPLWITPNFILTSICAKLHVWNYPACISEMVKDWKQIAVRSRKFLWGWLDCNNKDNENNKVKIMQNLLQSPVTYKASCVCTTWWNPNCYQTVLVLWPGLITRPFHCTKPLLLASKERVAAAAVTPHLILFPCSWNKPAWHISELIFHLLWNTSGKTTASLWCISVNLE